MVKIDIENMNFKIDSTKVKQIRDLIDKSTKISIVCHMTPDGDALGSSLGLMHCLRGLNKKVTVITPDTPPATLNFLPGFHEILIASRFPDQAKNLLMASEIIFCLDFNAIHRIDRLGLAVIDAPAPKIMIDHHLYPEDFPAITISVPEMSSTCELLYLVLKSMDMDILVGREAAECIYTGMLTDTGNFTYNSNDPKIYLIIAELLGKGLDKDRIYELAWNTNSENRLRICGYALYEKMELLREHGLSLIVLTKDELQEFKYVKGDTEGLVNRPLSIPGIFWSVYIREDESDYIKISMRSKGDFAVNEICEKLYHGGGHLNAAGGEYRGSLEEALKIFKESLQNE